jgi:hypothetical protein
MSFDLLDDVYSGEELSLIHRHFQKVLSLSLTGYRATEAVTDRVIAHLHKALLDFLKPHRYAAFHRRQDGVYLNDWKLPDSFVLRRLFDTGHCAGLCFQPGLEIKELRECMAEMEACLQGGSASRPLGTERNFLRHYYWIPPDKPLPYRSVDQKNSSAAI